MPGQRHRVKFDGILVAIMALLVLGGLIALGFLRDISTESRALVVMVVSVGIFGCFAGLMSLSALRKRLRRRVWQKAMVLWKASSQARKTSQFVVRDNLSDGELRQLAIYIYSRIGYRILDREGEDGYIHLINPDGKAELIACKQQPDLIKLHHVYSLELEMKRTKAIRGFFWAPAGFTSEAIDWVLHRPIVLIDRQEIGRFADCAQTNGSHVLDYL